MQAARDFFVGGFDWDGTTGRGAVVVGLVTLVAIMALSPMLAGMSGGRLSAQQVDSALSAFVLVQLYGTIVRRLHDAGRSGFWLLLAVLPYMPLLMMLALLALPRGAGIAPPRQLWRRVGFVLTVLLALFLVSRLWWIDHLVEGEQMGPTLRRGDWVAARTYFGPPERGDVVVVATPDGGDIVLRVVGLPGERVSQEDRGIAIDAVPAEITGEGAVLTETLPGGVSHAVVPLIGGGSALVAEVPEGFVLVLGDNRALDAAFASEARLAARMVPESYVRARVFRIVASSGAWRGGLPAWLQGMRWDRVWTAPQ